jgi:hypothetical protein
MASATLGFAGPAQDRHQGSDEPETTTNVVVWKTLVSFFGSQGDWFTSGDHFKPVSFFQVAGPSSDGFYALADDVGRVGFAAPQAVVELEGPRVALSFEMWAIGYDDSSPVSPLDYVATNRDPAAASDVTAIASNPTTSKPKMFEAVFEKVDPSKELPNPQGEYRFDIASGVNTQETNLSWRESQMLAGLLTLETESEESATSRQQMVTGTPWFTFEPYQLLPLLAGIGVAIREWTKKSA